MNPLLSYEIGTAIHRERVNRLTARALLETRVLPGRTPRETLAAGLVALAAWLAPATPVRILLERATSSSPR